LYAIDDEHRTGKEMALSPLGAQHAASGAAVAGALLSLAAAFPTLVVAMMLGLRATPADAAKAALIVLPAALVAAGLGVLTAVGLRTHRLIQPVIILLALGSYFASGGFIPVTGLPPLARHIAPFWPVSYIFGWANPVLHGFEPGPPTWTVAATSTAGAVVLAAAMVAARADRGQHPAQGQ
jgi:ABC-type polysaccharide/polyol phosphate export permease